MKGKLSFISGFMSVILLLSLFTTNNSMYAKDNDEIREVTVTLSADMVKDNQIVIDEYSNVKNLKLRFKQEELVNLFAEFGFLDIIVDKGSIESTITLDNPWIKYNNDVILTILENSNSEAVTSTYEVSFLELNGSAVPIYIQNKLKIDKSLVKNINDLILYYFNENGTIDYNNFRQLDYNTEDSHVEFPLFYGNTKGFAVFEDDFHSVASDVYEVWPYFYIYKDTKEVHHIDYSWTKEYKDSIRMHFGDYNKHEVLDVLYDNPNARILIDKENVSVNLPLKLFVTDMGAYFKIYEKEFEDAVGPVFDIVHQKFDKTYIPGSKADNMKLKFKINPVGIKDWENFFAYSIKDGKQVVVNPLMPTQINKNTGEIWFDIPKFGTYGLFDKYANVAAGWHEDDNGYWYYADNKGNLVKGWTKAGGKWYYLDEETGVMQIGWTKVGPKWYYLDGTGAMATGWTKVGTKWYYLDGSGAMVTDWTKIDAKWYYLDGSGAMASGWTKVGTTWYYLDDSGAMTTGWIKVDAKWYYLDSSGAMATSWAKVGGEWYYLEGSGAMVTGWAKVGTKWYYLDNSGAMQTGWVKIGTNWYYLNNSGAMQTGSITISGKTYFLNNSGVWVN